MATIVQGAAIVAKSLILKGFSERKGTVRPSNVCDFDCAARLSRRFSAFQWL